MVTWGVACGLLSLLVHLVPSTKCKQSHVIVSKHVVLFLLSFVL